MVINQVMLSIKMSCPNSEWKRAKPNPNQDMLPGLGVQRTRTSASVTSLKIGNEEKILCKWICVRRTAIFPLMKCYFRVPMGDTPFGPITRIENVEVMCANSNMKGRDWEFGQVFEPYAKWYMRTPFNLYNGTQWTFDMGVWRKFMRGEGDQIVYDAANDTVVQLLSREAPYPNSTVQSQLTRHKYCTETIKDCADSTTVTRL